MYTLLHELAVDSHKAVGPDNPLQQMIVNSHFPAYLSLHQDNCGELLVAESHPIDNSLRLLPVLGNENWRTTTPGTPGVIANVIEEILHVSLKNQDEAA